MNHGAGFTLIELLATLAIVALVTTLASPAFQETLLNARRTQILNALVRSLHLARVESLRSGLEAVVCPVDQDRLCIGRDQNWAGGWRVFLNAADSNPSSLEAGDRLLLAQQAATSGELQSNRSAFVYRPFNRRSTNGTLIYCDRRGERSARAVIVSHTGRPRISDRTAGGDVLRCPMVS
ncbi:MAG: GspH/FimT family pseudopilin [Gammaproteobacteria bacterium]